MLNKVINTATTTLERVNTVCILQLIHAPHLSVCWLNCTCHIRASSIQTLATQIHAWGPSCTNRGTSRHNRTVWLRLRCKWSGCWCSEAKLRGWIRAAGLYRWWVHRMRVRWLTCGWITRIWCIVTRRIWRCVCCWVSGILRHSRGVYMASKARIEWITKLNCSMIRWRVHTRIWLLGGWHSRTSL
jgi:hypothetical protein